MSLNGSSSNKSRNTTKQNAIFTYILPGEAKKETQWLIFFLHIICFCTAYWAVFCDWHCTKLTYGLKEQSPEAHLCRSTNWGPEIHLDRSTLELQGGPWKSGKTPYQFYWLAVGKQTIRTFCSVHLGEEIKPLGFNCTVHAESACSFVLT